MVQKLTFEIKSIVDENRCQLDSYWDDKDLKMFNGILERAEVDKRLHTPYGADAGLVRFKDDGYGFYISVDNDKDEELKEIEYRGEKVLIVITSDVEFYISNNILKVIEAAEAINYLNKEGIMNIAKEVARNEDLILIELT